MEKFLLLPHALQAAMVFLVGLMFGSFANVCIYRIPRKESVTVPASHCPSCGTGIHPWDNIPLFSYLILGGKCRQCKTAISFVYPLVEFITAALVTALFWKFGFTLEFLVYFLITPALVIITMIDLEHKIIPDVITLPGIVLGLLAGSYLNGIIDSGLGLVAGGGLFYTLAVLSRGGMGGGDIKYIAGAGALLGWKKVLLTIFLGSFLGSVVGLALMALGKKGRKSEIPFGPYLVAGTYIAILFGDELIGLYLRWVT